MRMESCPRVSAITIFLNEERHLREALQSVIDQSYDDWELILVDDGSTDRSAAIAADIVGMDPHRIRLLHHEGRSNRGMSASRNLGLAHARGEFVGFLDADDCWTPDKLVEQVGRLDHERDAGLIYGRTLIWHEWEDGSGSGSGSIARDYYYDLGVEPDRTYQPPHLFRVLLRNKAQTPTTCNAMMRRSLIQRIGGFEDSFTGMFEDQVFFAKALLAAPAHVSGRTWAKYRQHERSHSALSAGNRTVDQARVRFLRWLKGYLAKGGQADPAVLRAVLPDVEREMSAARISQLRHRLKRLIGLPS